jgi:succinoglycan biosynthesis transport protein ExoP
MENHLDSPGGAVEFWGAIRRRKGALILFAFAGALAGFLFSRSQTPVYQARTSIEIVRLNDNFLNIKQVNPETAATSEIADLQTQVKILLSESLLGRVLAKLKQAPFAGGSEDAIKKAQQSVKVHATGPARILEITADSADPAAAADFANTLTSEFIQQNLEARTKTTENTTQWLASQIEAIRVKLERSEDRLQAYARKSGLMFTADQTSVSEDQLGRLRQSLSAAQAERIVKQSRYEMAQASPPEALPDVLNDESLRDYRAKLTELRRQIAELGETYNPEHPKMMRVQAQLSTIWAALERERADIVKRIANEYDEARRKESLIGRAYAELAQRVSGESEKIIRYRILKREVDSNRLLYDTMLQQLKQSGIATGAQASNARVVDPARVPTRPYKPDVALGSGFGLLAGVFLGVAFVVIRERADCSIRQPGETPSYLNVPELGVIPSGAIEPAAHKLARLGARLRRTANAGCVELITWQRKPSLISESFRSALLSISCAGESGNVPQVLVIASAGPSEGKSTVASNLGIAIAELGKKVLLIDADLRKPRMQQIFSLTNERGLSDVLRERHAANGHGAPDKLIRKTEVPGLFVMTSGPGVTPAMNLFNGAHMPDLLRRLRAEFKTILIDTPPMLQLPDARAIGRMADQVILVVRCGVTSRDSAISARQRFAEDGTRILGTILNGWNPKTAPNGSYGRDNASYRSVRKHYASRGAHA